MNRMTGGSRLDSYSGETMPEATVQADCNRIRRAPHRTAPNRHTDNIVSIFPVFSVCFPNVQNCQED